jgi:FixJ family two-component response regulator
MLEADPTQIERLLVELSLNSRDAMGHGGRLLIEAENADLDDEYAQMHPSVRPGCYVRIKVSDTGAGMSPETLRTAHEIVTATQGRIDIYSEAGIGTTAKIHLPVSGAAAARAKPTERRYRTGKGEVVLVVEDEADASSMAGRILAKAGYHVIDTAMAPTALGALDRCERPVDLLLTDLVGAAVRGDALADRARELRPDLRILYTSGHSRVVLDPRVTRGGNGCAFIEKPFSARALLRAVRRLLDAPATALRGRLALEQLGRQLREQPNRQPDHVRDTPLHPLHQR